MCLSNYIVHYIVNTIYFIEFSQMYLFIILFIYY